MVKYINKDHIIYWTVILILVLSLILSINSCGTYRDDYTVVNTSLGKVRHERDSIKNMKGQIVYEDKTAQVDDKDYLKEISKEQFAMRKKDEELIKTVKALIAESNRISIIDTTPIVFDTTGLAVRLDSLYKTYGYIDVNSVLVPPLPFKRENKIDSTNYTISGIVQMDGVKFNEISLKDSTYTRIIDKKRTGFFNKLVGNTDETIQILHTNKFVSNTGINAVTYKPKVNKKVRWGERVVVALIGGYLGYKLAK